MTTLIIITIALLPIVLFLAYKYGYTKGVHDLTKEIDEGIKKLKQQKDD